MTYWRAPNGKRKHRRRDCHALDGAATVEECETDDLPACQACRWSHVATLGDA